MRSLPRPACMTTCLLILVLNGAPANARDWKSLEPGLSLRTFAGGDGQAFRIDLSRWRLSVVEAGDGGARVEALARNQGASLAVNGGFFDPSFRALGLLVSAGKQLNRLRRADWGVLSVTRRGSAKLVHTRNYKRRSGTDFAIQSGPRLVTDGRLLSLKAQSARRTAIGIPPGGRELVLVVVRSPMLTMELARHMRDTLGCRYAVNLDGGSSTQLWSKHARVRNETGFPVANAVLVSPR